jgi:hypothetical protein
MTQVDTEEALSCNVSAASGGRSDPVDSPTATIVSLNEFEHVRLRPEMYIGTREPAARMEILPPEETAERVLRGLCVMSSPGSS